VKYLYSTFGNNKIMEGAQISKDGHMPPLDNSSSLNWYLS